MPRRPRTTAPAPVPDSPAPVLPSTALVASSARYAGKVARIYQPQQTWQAEAYRHYGICGEARYAAKFFGHALSRATLSAGVVKDGQVVPSPPGVLAELDLLFAGKHGQTEMLEAFGTHLTIAGECYLVGRKGEDGQDIWEVVSVLEMQVQGERWAIRYGDGITPVVLTDEDVVIRIWLPNPAKRIEADSPFRSLLPILGEIEWLTRHVFAQIQSRLAGAGILFLPNSMTFPQPPPVDGEESVTTDTATAFMKLLGDVMVTPIQNPGSPAAITPIVVTAEGEDIDKAKLLTFWTQLDAESKELRNEAIRRFALGMDLPPEEVLGMSSNSGTGGGTTNGVSHWGAWQIEESTIKLHVEPMLDSVVNALTISYLRPLLSAGSIDRVVYDTKGLRLRPDRSKEAAEAYDRGLLSAEEYLKETGLNPQGKPTDEEFKRWLIVKVATGSATPEQVAAALSILGVNLPVILTAEPVPTGNETRPAPSLEDHPTRDLPEAAALRGELLAACDALTYRALERVGNRLRQDGQRPPGIPAYETYRYVEANGSTKRLLEDAWSCAPQVLSGICDVAKVVPVLDSYVEMLLTEQAPHTRERLADWFEMARI